jgi:hypothetical protein
MIPDHSLATIHWIAKRSVIITVAAIQPRSWFFHVSLRAKDIARDLFARPS